MAEEEAKFQQIR
jgi:prefoldin subunit 2